MRYLFILFLFLFNFSKSQISFNDLEVLNGYTYGFDYFKSIGDINNDGYPEIFITTDNNFTPNHDYFYLLNVGGDLNYFPRIYQEPISEIYMDFLYDIDNDGLLDIVGQDGLVGVHYYWLKNLGNNNFQNSWESIIESHFDYFSSDLFYDYNGDDFVDYFVTTTQGEVFRYTNLQGNGFSTPELVFYTDDTFLGHIREIKFLDFNHDGHEDLLIRSFFTEFDLYLNDGSDHFEYHIPIDSQANEDYLASFDFDGNSLNDFVIYDENSLKIRTFFYDEEDEEYFYQDELIDNPFTHVLSNVFVISRIVDFNQDGLMDIFITTGPNESSYANLYYYENLGNQEFAEKQLIKENLNGHFEFLFADLNSDDELDILMISDRKIYAFYNEGNLNFTEQIAEQYLKTSNKTFFFDVNNDGNIDILNGKRNLSWYENRGENDWSGRRFFTSLNSDFNRNHNYELIDVDNDGLFDVISNETDDDISVDLEGNFFSIFKNLGDSNFEKIYSLEYEYLDHWENYNTFKSSLNEYPDIYFVKTTWSGQSDSLFIIKNNNGVFDQPLSSNILPNGTIFKPYHSDFELADLNNDGLPEIIYYDYSHNDNTYRLNFLQNVGENTFEKKIITTSIFMGAQKIHVFDYDSDGDLDIFLSDGMNEKPFRVYENENMVFNEITIDNHLIVENLLLHDINNDGLLDILTIGYYGYNHPEYEYLNTIFYFENQGNGKYEKFLVNQFESHYSNEVLEKSNIYLYDKNLDGKLDILISCADTANTLLFYLNTSNLEVIDQNDNLNLTKVYPNPFSEVINWKSIQSNNNYDVSIFDLTGKKVFHNNIKQTYLDLSFLEKGIYILKIDNASFKVIKK